MFVVGDPKQSIYRFRRADIELYGRVVESLTDDVLELTESFRSRPGIIDWVNATLGALIQDDGDGLQVAYSPLHAFRPADPQVQVPVARLGGPVPKAAVSRRRRSGSARPTSSPHSRAGHPDRGVAGPGRRRTTRARCRSTRPSDEWVRPARFADIAVLVPTRTLLPELETAFEAADVPLRIESQSLLFATTECRDLVAILGAIDDPADEIRLVAALRTPAFGCSDADLLDYRDAGGRWSIFGPPPETLPPDHPVVAGLAELRPPARPSTAGRPRPTRSSGCVRERGLLTLALGHRRPRDHWRRLRFLTDAAHAFTDAGGASLRGFVQWLDEQTRGRGAGQRVGRSPSRTTTPCACSPCTGARASSSRSCFSPGLGVRLRANSAALYHGDPEPEIRLTTNNGVPTPRPATRPVASARTWPTAPRACGSSTSPRPAHATTSS